jgi:hypothetical protein
MVPLHSPWPLFCGDLALAQEWLLSGWSRLERLPFGWAMMGLSLGLVEESRALLVEIPCRLAYPLDRQLAFRLARGAGEANPYPALIPEGAFQQDQAFLAEIQRRKAPLPVELVGGIGDHLELLSLLLPWARAREQPLLLLMPRQRQRQLQRLLVRWPGIQLGDPPERRDAVLQALNLRSLLYGLGQAQFQAWIEAPPAQARGQLICCWRAAGADAPHSAWCRSVPWQLVEALYRRLIAAGRPAASIVDLSHWQPWEAAALRSLGIQLHNPAGGDVLALAERISGAEVLTIDTALAHLCAALGQPARVLLPRFADERWMELHRPQHCYGQALQLHRQRRYADWGSELSELPIN